MGQNTSKIAGKSSPDSGIESKTCVFVVEDEFLIRMMLSEALREAGFNVVEAGSADEALPLIEVIEPDLIVTDVKMPGAIDGLELLASVRKAKPLLPIIVTSATLGRTPPLPDDRTLFIPKPYSFTDLVETIQKKLED